MSEDLVGQILVERYRVLRLLGKGAMGEVYEVELVALPDGLRPEGPGVTPGTGRVGATCRVELSVLVPEFVGPVAADPPQ